MKAKANGNANDMSYVRIWVHIVFSTQNHEQYLSADLRYRLFTHIKENCRSKDIFLDSIGGWSDHIHLLVSLGREQAIANGQKLLKGKFRWQDDYFAISVSESQVETVRAYIRNQEEHHRAVPFAKELETLKRITKELG